MAEKLVMTHSSAFLLPPSTPDAVSGSAPTTYALIILNQRLPRFSPILWQHGKFILVPVLSNSNDDHRGFYDCFCCCRAAKIRLCADGGANRLFDNMPELCSDEHDDATVIHKRYKPDVIKGDMDSIRPDVLDFYKNLGTEIVDNSDDQDTTDLHKCITYVRDFMSDDDKSNLCILVAGALGGRFDHEMGNINTLYRFKTTQIVLLSDECLIHLLPSSRHHEIHIQSSLVGPHCGLIPIGAPSGSSTTTGLQWNLENTEMRFGGLVSTSNVVTGEIVTVRSDSDILWTISVKNQQ